MTQPPSQDETASPQAGGRLRRVLLRIALLAASAAVGLALAEVAVRIAGLHVPPRGDIGMQGLVRDVPADVAQGVEFLLIPDQTRTASYPGAPGQPPRVVTYGINSLGFRGGPAEQKKADGVFRIVILGDSFTYGTGVDQGETWPVYLEQRLAELAPGRPVEVLNWGVPAYNSRQQVGLLNFRGQAFEPDLVVLCAYINDASGEARGDGAPGGSKELPWEVRWVQRLGLTSGRWAPEAPKTPAQERTMWLRERSRLADLVAWKLNGWLMGRVAGRNYVEDWSEGSAGLAMVKSSLAAAAVLARRDGFALVATMYPDLTGLGGDYAFAGEHATFASICDELRIPFHDLLPALDGEDPAALRVHAHDKHPNARANRLVADRLAEALQPLVQGE